MQSWLHEPQQMICPPKALEQQSKKNKFKNVLEQLRYKRPMQTHHNAINVVTDVNVHFSIRSCTA
jgi:hypothetical protein